MTLGLAFNSFVAPQQVLDRERETNTWRDTATGLQTETVCEASAERLGSGAVRRFYCLVQLIFKLSDGVGTWVFISLLFIPFWAS